MQRSRTWLAGLRIRARWVGRAFGRRNELILVPPTHGGSGRARPDDYRRVVTLVATLAVGFFFPSLVIASVPANLWLPFGFAASMAGVVISATFFFIPFGSPRAIPASVINASVVTLLGAYYAPYFHQVALLFMLVVAAHSVVHGFRGAIGAVVIGAFAVPLVIQRGMGFNSTDTVYSTIYLFGAALIPWTAARLAERRATALQAQLAQTKRIRRETVLVLARAAEARDEVTGEHITRVGDLSVRLAERAGLDAALIEELRYAAMLHDVGKLHIPDRILLKPGPLSPEERALIQQHTVKGERILGEWEGLALARQVVRWHHEAWDGTGYPDGLAGERIPITSRIVHLVDVYDALVSERPYKQAWSLERAWDELVRQSGRHFDPGLVQLFEGLVDEEVSRRARLAGIEGSTRAGPVVGLAGAD